MLEHTYTKSNHGTPLRCVAVHQAYQTKSEAVEVIMDVQCEYHGDGEDPGSSPARSAQVMQG